MLVISEKHSKSNFLCCGCTAAGKNKLSQQCWQFKTTKLRTSIDSAHRFDLSGHIRAVGDRLLARDFKSIALRNSSTTLWWDLIGQNGVHRPQESSKVNRWPLAWIQTHVVSCRIIGFVIRCTHDCILYVTESLNKYEKNPKLNMQFGLNTH